MVRSGTAVVAMASHTLRKLAFGVPVVRSTISGV